MPKKQQESPRVSPLLTKSIEVAKASLEDRLRLGNDFRNRHITHGGEMETSKADIQKWSDYNVRLLEGMFTTEQVAREYEQARPGPWDLLSFQDPTQADYYNHALQVLSAELKFLDSLLNRIELYGTADFGRGANASKTAPTGVPNRVFIVHGRDEASRESVARFLERLGIEAIILHEQANRGGTIIEKLERYSDVHFAVVLITGDDEGRLKESDNPLMLRARQNVVLELGYFVGRLGRENVCALYREGVELPSDWGGVAWVSLDSADAWKYSLARELKAAKFSFDMNLLL